MLTGEQREHDHQSDPAHTPGDGWVDEGGASHLGPATHLAQETNDAHEHDNDAIDEEDDDSA